MRRICLRLTNPQKVSHSDQQQTDQSEVPDPIQERGPAQRVRFGQREDSVAEIVPQQLEHLPKQGGDEDPGDDAEDRIAQPDEGRDLAGADQGARTMGAST